MTAVSDTPASTPLLIGGQERPGGDGTFPVADPARRGAVVGYAAAASAADADAGERAEILSRENGKVRFEATIDLHVFVGRFHQAAEFAPELDTPEHIAGPPFNTTITRQPAGLVTIIYPFNWPLAILAASLPYALMAGNTVIVKPPPATPLSSVLTLRHLVRALPPGVLNVVTGADEILGPVVVGDPRIKHVCFTGSVGGGRRIMTMAAANLTNVTLELGGNDPGRAGTRPGYHDGTTQHRAPARLRRRAVRGSSRRGRRGAHLLQQPQRHRGRRARPLAGSTPAASAASSAGRACTSSPRPTSWPSPPTARERASQSQELRMIWAGFPSGCSRTP